MFNRMVRVQLVLAITVMLAYLIYDPAIPKGYCTSSYLYLSVMQAGMNFARFLALTLERFDIVPTHLTLRMLCPFCVYVIPQPTNGVITWYDAVLEGVSVRVYEPREKKGLLPGFVYYHGGGWVMGDLDSYHHLTHRVAQTINAVLISVDYRLAPEHPFPAAHDDCFIVTKFFIKNAANFAVDSNRIGIGGDSAGGGLAATVALRLRDENITPRIKIQILLYPAILHFDIMLPSLMKNQHGIFLKRSDLKLYVPQYMIGSSKYSDEMLNNAHIPLAILKELSNKYFNLSKLPTKYTTGFTRPDSQEPDKKLWDDIRDVSLNPYYTPIVAENATGLPTAYIYTGEHDVIRDHGFLYASKLVEGGNKVEHFNHDLGFHSIFYVALDLPETHVAFRHMTDFVSRNLL